MKPAFSIIFFTVSSGAGLGLVFLLAMARFAHSAPPSTTWWIALLLGLVMITAGLLSSVGHLANPKNAWRGLSRFATSWVSREGVFAIALYGAVFFYGLSILYGSIGLQRVLGLVVMALAMATLVSTAMIYACLKTIPRWNNWQTIALYPLFALSSGAVLMLAIFPPAIAIVVRWIVVFFTVVAGLIWYWRAQSQRAKNGPTLLDALRQSLGTPRLLDVGHSHQSFLTREFGYELHPARAHLLHWAVIMLAFVLPVAIVIGSPQVPALAAVSAIVGLFIERWLFFAQAQHVVRLYHGQSVS